MKKHFLSSLLSVGILFSAIGLVEAQTAKAIAKGKSDTKSTTGQIRTRVEPYKGPPIYLPQPESPPPATQVEVKQQTEKYENGKPRIERSLARYSDNSLVSEGAYREFFTNGQLFVEGSYSSGKPDGTWTYYHPDGEVAKKVGFKNGLVDGVVEVYRPDGSLQAQREYADGKRNGKWITYQEESEKLALEEIYTDGLADGVWKSWYANGQQHRETPFKAGKREGVAKEWQDDGFQQFEANFADNKLDGLVTRWTREGEKQEQRYEAGKLIRQ